jgi:hypothetical protein
MLYGGVIIVPPEVLYALDLAAKLLKRSFVDTIFLLVFVLPEELLIDACSQFLKVPGVSNDHQIMSTVLPAYCLPVEVHIPVMLCWQRSHCLKHVLFSIVSLLCRRSSITLLGRCQAFREEGWSKCHLEVNTVLAVD